MTGTNESTAPAADAHAPTVTGVFLRRGAGFGALAGPVIAAVGFVIGIQVGTTVDVTDPGQQGLIGIFAFVAGLAGFVVGPFVGLLTAGVCLTVRMSAETWTRRARLSTMVVTGGLAAAVITLIAALGASELAAGPPWGYVVLAASFGALVAGRAERAWSGWKD